MEADIYQMDFPEDNRIWMYGKNKWLNGLI